MEQNEVLARFELAKRRVKLGRDRIDRQRRVIATLFATGADTAEAENRVHLYERLQDKYLADMERLSNSLESVPNESMRVLKLERAARTYRPNARTLTTTALAQFLCKVTAARSRRAGRYNGKTHDHQRIAIDDAASV